MTLIIVHRSIGARGAAAACMLASSLHCLPQPSARACTSICTPGHAKYFWWVGEVKPAGALSCGLPDLGSALEEAFKSEGFGQPLSHTSSLKPGLTVQSLFRMKLGSTQGLPATISVYQECDKVSLAGPGDPVLLCCGNDCWVWQCGGDQPHVDSCHPAPGEHTKRKRAATCMFLREACSNLSFSVSALTRVCD